MKAKRRRHDPEFKARVALEAPKGVKTLQQIAKDHEVHPVQVSDWKKTIQEGVAGVFFVTSEKCAWDQTSDRLFTIRRFDPDTSLVSTVGRFQQYKSRKVAEEEMRVLADNYVEDRDYGL